MFQNPSTLRQLSKIPGFSAIAIFTMAIGIALTMTVFSMVNAILLRPFPVEEPERLVTLSMFDQQQGATPRGSMSYPDLEEFRAQARSLSGVFGMYTDHFVLGGDQGAERIQGSVASPNIFQVLGVLPIHGRDFIEEDSQSGSAGVVLISHGLWQRRFNSNPDLDQIEARLNGGRVEVIGVMPPGFRFPVESEIWMPLSQNTSPSRGNRFLKVVGRLNEGVQLHAAHAEALTISSNLAEQFPDTNQRLNVRIYPLKALLIPGQVTDLLWLLLGAVLCVLLIACVNVSGLLLVRGWSRAREMAIRTSLGASRWDIMRLLLSESLCLSMMAGMIGLFMSLAALDGVLALMPVEVPFWIHFNPDTRVIAFALAISILSGLMAGLLPAWQVSKRDPSELIKTTGVTSTPSRSHLFLRHAFIVCEVGVSFALMMGSGLMIRSFLSTQKTDLGFETTNRLVFHLTPPEVQYPGQIQKVMLIKRLIENLESRPEIAAVAAVHPSLPLDSFSSTSLYVPVGRLDDEARHAGNIHVIGNTPQVLGVPLLKGRYFNPEDGEGDRPVCLINQTMADRFFENENPVGRRIRFSGSSDEGAMTILGVVGDIRRNAIHDPAENQVYRPYEQVGWGSGFAFVIKTNVDPVSLAGAVAEAVRQFDPGLAMDVPIPLEKHIQSNESYWMTRMNSWLFGCLSIGAVLITVCGIYGLVAFSVGQRTREFGLRIALGASQADLFLMVLRQAGKVVVAGLGLGTILAFGLGLAARSILYGVSPFDPTSFAIAFMSVVGAVLIAECIPAQRAARTDPVNSLKVE